MAAGCFNLQGRNIVKGSTVNELRAAERDCGSGAGVAGQNFFKKVR